jgi:hypothetical protein
MKSELTLPYQIGPLRKVALLIFLPNLVISVYLLYAYYHQASRWMPHEKLMRPTYLWFLFPYLLISLVMFVDCFDTRTVFTESEIHHMSAIQDLRRNYNDLLQVKQAHKFSGPTHRFMFRDGKSFQLNLLTARDVEGIIAVLRKKSPDAHIEITLRLSRNLN